MTSIAVMDLFSVDFVSHIVLGSVPLHLLFLRLIIDCLADLYFHQEVGFRQSDVKGTRWKSPGSILCKTKIAFSSIRTLLGSTLNYSSELTHQGYEYISLLVV